MIRYKLFRRELIYYLVSIWCATILFVFTSQSQIYYPFTFGCVTELKSIENSIGLVAGDFNGDQGDDLAVYNRNKIKIFYQSTDSLNFLFKTFNFNSEVSRVLSSELNNDKYSDIVCIGGKPLKIQSYIFKRRGEPVFIWERLINESYDDLIIADVNSDGKMDIILFGKKELGMMVFIGRGNATFRSPQIIYPDYSFSKIEITDINKDGINDITGIDWIENDVLIFTGFGNMVFSEPIRIKLNRQLEMLRSGDFNGDGNIDLFIYSPSENRGSIYLGSGFGNFNEYQNIHFTDDILNVVVSDINNDLHSDLLLLNKKENLLIVYTANENGYMTDYTPFTIQNAVDITLFTDQFSKRINAAILDSQNKIIKVFYNAEKKFSKKFNIDYAVSSDPEEVKVVDLNNDGWNDIVVANRNSKSYSIFINDKSGYYRGQWSVQTQFMPENILIPESQTLLSYIFSVSSIQNEINVTELDLNHFSHNNSKINFQVSPILVGFESKKNSYGISFFVIEQDIENNQNYLSEFKAGGKYSENTLEFNVDGKIISTSRLEILKNGDKEFWCIAFNDSLRQEKIYKIFLDSNSYVSKIKLISSYEVNSSPVAIIVSGDLNNDGRSDCIIAKNDTNNLYLYLDNLKTEPATIPNFIMRDIEVKSPNDIKVMDVDKNQRNDIIVNDKKRKSLDVYLGLGYGRFSGPISLFGTARCGGFDITDIDNDNHFEIVFTDKFKNTLTVLPLPRF